MNGVWKVKKKLNASRSPQESNFSGQPKIVFFKVRSDNELNNEKACNKRETMSKKYLAIQSEQSLR